MQDLQVSRRGVQSSQWRFLLREMLRKEISGEIQIAQKGYGEKMNWISVKDKLPEEGQYIIFYVPEFNSVLTGYWRGNVWWGREDYENYYPSAVTHWMPLPHPPVVRVNIARCNGHPGENQYPEPDKEIQCKEHKE